MQIKSFYIFALSVDKYSIFYLKLFDYQKLTAKVIHFYRFSNLMKRVKLFFMIFVPILMTAQVNESFTDGDFLENPEWIGTSTNFKVNTDGQLQSSAVATSVSYLSTPSEAFVNAVWECWVKINYTTSSSNYASIYLVSDNSELINGCNGYYVQVGGTNDEVSLFLQQGTKKTKIIDGADKRTDSNPIELRIRVKRDANGNFELFSQLPSESNFVKEGSVQNNVVKNSSYFALLYSNTSTTGSAYFFDNVVVSGENAPDTEAPDWQKIHIVAPDKLELQFTEKMSFGHVQFEVDEGVGELVKTEVAVDKKSVKLTFAEAFEKGNLYTLYVTGLTDLAGNEIKNNTQNFGIPETILPGDLVWNEVMFENPEHSTEYVEIYNKSEKVLDVSGLIFTTRKTDGELNSGNKVPAQTLIGPQRYMVFCPAADSLTQYYKLLSGLHIVQTPWSVLNNESATLVLCNAAKDTVYDELTYNVKWHHVLVKEPKGVAFERINPELPTQNSTSWHSAASDVDYGTPGYKNSQYRELESVSNPDKFVWTEPEAFSPDNDGNDDVCFVRYALNSNGYVANVLILNAAGVKICELANNILLQAEGFLSWDGKTDKGLNVNPGIYVLYFEMFNPVTGDKKSKKLPIAVSFR